MSLQFVPLQKIEKYLVQNLGKKTKMKINYRESIQCKINLPVNRPRDKICLSSESLCGLVAKMVKEFTYSARDPGSIPGLGRSPGDGNGNPLQHSCLKNSMDRRAWQSTVHEVAKSQTRLSNKHFHFHSLCCRLNSVTPKFMSTQNRRM